jgi:hypothetical protein
MVAVALYGGVIVVMSTATLLPIKTIQLPLKGVPEVKAIQTMQINNQGGHLTVGYCQVFYPNVHVFDINSKTLLFQLTSAACVYYSLDCSCIYGSCRYGRLLCWDDVTSILIRCPFSVVVGSASHYRSARAAC